MSSRSCCYCLSNFETAFVVVVLLKSKKIVFWNLKHFLFCSNQIEFFWQHLRQPRFPLQPSFLFRILIPSAGSRSAAASGSSIVGPRCREQGRTELDGLWSKCAIHLLGKCRKIYLRPHPNERSEPWVAHCKDSLFTLKLKDQVMENFSTRRWTTIPAPSVSYSVHEIKKNCFSCMFIIS